MKKVIFQASDMEKDFISDTECALATAIKRHFNTDRVHIGYTIAYVDDDCYWIYYEHESGFYHGQFCDLQDKFKDNPNTKAFVSLYKEVKK